MTAFQKNLNNQLPIGVKGDFASVNPFASMLTGAGKLTAGEGGVKVGIFAFADTKTGKVKNKFEENTRVGFVLRNNNALITSYLEGASMTIPDGMGVSLYTTGDFLTVFGADVTAGQIVFATHLTGEPAAADVGATVADASPTNFIVAESAVAGQLCKITVLG